MYSKEFKPERYHSIEYILDEVKRLKEGVSCWINDLPKEELYRKRRLLYDWLYHKDLTKLHRIRVIDGDLRISRLPASDFDGNLPPYLRPFFERRLLLVEDEEKAVEILKKKKEHFTLAEKEALLEEWRKVMK